MKPTEIVAGHIDNSIARALKSESWLDPEVLKIHGFSTPTMRHLFSNLCHVEDLRYLEVGCFCGGTFVAAFNNNPVHAVGIENFSQDFSQKGVRDQLCANLTKWRDSARSVEFIEDDAFGIAKTKWPLPFDVFFYDGSHEYSWQAHALPAFLDSLADRFLFIVDDFHWNAVRDGTKSGFESLADRVKIEQQWFLSGNRANDDAIWHNGLAIFLCSKIK